jgi:glutamate-1-semialdehyde 2,1-aminomutase
LNDRLKGDIQVTSSIEKYIATHQNSQKLWERALKVSRGIHSDPAFIYPFSIYFSHAKGPRKWDVDGNEYIDYTMGYGGLLLGHAHPALLEAVTRQISKGTHFGAENELEIEWAELICQLIPVAERVEFALSGTEANMLIARLVRAFTGRNKILKFAEHYFGWDDDTMPAVAPPYDKLYGGQLPPIYEDTVSGTTVVIPCNDADAMEKALSREDIAGLFLEGGGANCGRIGMPPELVHKARELTLKHGTLMVIDEVISGFRWSPGGYQAAIGVTPDISTLAKLTGGGFPGGAAVVGRAEVMEMFKLKPEDPSWNRLHHVVHRGTWNGNPLVSAAAIAALKIVAQGEVQKIAEASARKLADGVNSEIEKRGIEGCAHNASSIFHLHIGKCQKCDRTICLDATKAMAAGVNNALNMHLIQNGLHLLMGTMGVVSAVHTETDIEQSIKAFGAAFDGLLAEGIIEKPI